jgi:hypothetical protein
MNYLATTVTIFIAIFVNIGVSWALPPCADNTTREKCFGTHTYVDGSKYSGEFLSGLMHGEGILIYPDGRAKEGVWKSHSFQFAKELSNELLEALNTLPLSTSSPAGETLTQGTEWMDDFRNSIIKCWNVSAMPKEYSGVVITIGFSIKSDGMPDQKSIRLVSYEGSSDNAVRSNYEAARRAIIRCGARGFKLPLDKYQMWKDVELVFHNAK